MIDWNLFSVQVSHGVEDNVEEFTHDEQSAAANKLPSGKACCPDGIPNEMLSIAARVRPQTFLHVFNNCIRQSTFLMAWKEARLVLLHKDSGKPYEVPSSYRPLSMLNTAGKTLERLTLARLNRYLETAADPLSLYSSVSVQAGARKMQSRSSLTLRRRLQ